MAEQTVAHTDSNDLVISRLVRAPRAKLWQAWADPKLLKEWWCPKPWTTEVREFDMRPGGAFYTFMRGPDGGTSDNPGAFLEVVPQARIAFTSMLTGGWRPEHAVDALHGRNHDERRGKRHALHRHRDAPRPGHARQARPDGFPRRLGHLHHPARGICAAVALSVDANRRDK